MPKKDIPPNRISKMRKEIDRISKKEGPLEEDEFFLAKHGRNFIFFREMMKAIEEDEKGEDLIGLDIDLNDLIALRKAILELEGRDENEALKLRTNLETKLYPDKDKGGKEKVNCDKS